MAVKKREINVELIIKKAAQETVRELERAGLIKKDNRTHFQKTEKLLYSYPALKQAIKQKEKDIQYIQQYGMQRKSKSIVMYSSAGNGHSEEDQYIDILEGYIAAKARTERLVERIERALEVVNKDNYYFIITEKYFNQATNQDIEENFHVSVSTIRRHRNRLINELQIQLFGADAFEYLTES